MFTSRAEHRLLLGCDSVYERLSGLADRAGVLDDERRRRIEARTARIRAAEFFGDTTLNPDRETSRWMAEAGIPLTAQTTLRGLTQRAEFDVDRFIAASADALPELAAAYATLEAEEREAVVNRLRYSGYLERQQREADRMAGDEALQIPATMSFALPGLSREVVEKLTATRPRTLAQAGRIAGVTPAAIALLRMHLRRPASRAAAPEAEW